MTKITGASVKVMRSFDYCHFEVCLSTSAEYLPNGEELAAVDDLRKEAARLTDKAVEQYKIAKSNLESIGGDKWKMDQLRVRAREAEAKEESDRTPRDKVAIKALADKHYQDRRRYDYEDDFKEPSWDDDEEDVMF